MKVFFGPRMAQINTN